MKILGMESQRIKRFHLYFKNCRAQQQGNVKTRWNI